METVEELKPCLLNKNLREGNPCGLPRRAPCSQAPIVADRDSGFQIRPEEAFPRLITHR